MNILKFFLLTVFVLTASSAVEVNRLNIYYIEKEPYYFTDKNRASGFLLEKSQKIFNQLSGTTVQFIEMPPKRILSDLLELKGNHCSIGWFKNKERIEKYWFSPLLYRDRSMVIIAEKKFEKALSDFSRFNDFIKNTPLKIDVVNGYSYGDLIDGAIAKFPSSFNKDASDNIKLIRLLKNERTNGIVMMEEELEHFGQKESVLLDNYIVKTFSDFPKGNERYIICSKNTSEKCLNSLKTIMSNND
jgi:polar amino acid transport system substrate-binding protein